MKGVLFPILGKVIGVKIDHKCIKREGNQTIVLGTDPVTHTAVKNPSDDERDLIICNDLFMDKIVLATVLELTHDGGGYITSREYRDFGWQALLNRGYWGFVGRHDTEETEWAGNESD